MSQKTKAEAMCPCGKGESYESCCMVLHSGIEKANAAEQLMRSRYSAFYKGDIHYLIKTLHPSKRHPDEQKNLESSIQKTDWLSLRILDSSKTDIVEFVAFYKDPDLKQLHERSKFVFEDDQWYYLEGEFLNQIQLQRNEPCWCGSGKKFKKCHG